MENIIELTQRNHSEKNSYDPQTNLCLSIWGIWEWWQNICLLLSVLKSSSVAGEHLLPAWTCCIFRDGLLPVKGWTHWFPEFLCPDGDREPSGCSPLRSTSLDVCSFLGVVAVNLDMMACVRTCVRLWRVSKTLCVLWFICWSGTDQPIANEGHTAAMWLDRWRIVCCVTLCRKRQKNTQVVYLNQLVMVKLLLLSSVISLLSSHLQAFTPCYLLLFSYCKTHTFIVFFFAPVCVYSCLPSASSPQASFHCPVSLTPK